MKLAHPYRFAAILLLATVSLSYMAQVDKPQPIDPQPLTRQLQSVQAQADELAFALNEDLDALKVRQRAYELAAQAGTDSSWVDYAYHRSVEKHVDPKMTLGVIGLESNWRVDAYNLNTDKSEDKGLGGTNTRTIEFAASLAGIKNPNPYNPKDSIDMTVALLAYLGRQYDSPEAILTAFNRGEEGLRKWYVSRGTVRSPYSDEVERRMYR